jgi:hypothetical protein
VVAAGRGCCRSVRQNSTLARRKSEKMRLSKRRTGSTSRFCYETCPSALRDRVALLHTSGRSSVKRGACTLFETFFCRHYEYDLLRELVLDSSGSQLGPAYMSFSDGLWPVVT